ncbi:SCO family protein [Siccirubricoccus deserti]
MLFGGNAPVAAMGGVSLPQGMALGGAFTLVDQTGRTVTERDYAGRWMLIYFGYSFCPDVCPTELGVMTTAIDQLGPVGEQVVPVFITVDPQRDTPAHLADYVSRFHPRLQGLTGTPEQVAEAARRYRVYFSKVQRPDMTDYLMDHSSFVFLVGPDRGCAACSGRKPRPKRWRRRSRHNSAATRGGVEQPRHARVINIC